MRSSLEMKFTKIALLGVLLYIPLLLCEPTFKLNPWRFCNGKPVELLVWIHSAPHHSRKRNAIRMTWGSEAHYKGPYKAKVIFFVGLPSPGAKNMSDANTGIRHPFKPEWFQMDVEQWQKLTQLRLEYEYERHGDIVQGDFMDNYRNMTYKAVHSLRWISQYCQNAKFIMKVDDDVMVNIFKLLPYLRLKQFKDFYPQSVISCNLWKYAKPVRDPDDKWYISEEDYPDETFPPFCQGMVYFITPDLVPRLYNESLSVPYLFMDDVYVTGLLANRLQDPPVNFRRLSSEYAKAYGIGEKIVTWLASHKKKVTFIHTDIIDSYFECWKIIKSAHKDYDLDLYIPKNVETKRNFVFVNQRRAANASVT